MDTDGNQLTERQAVLLRIVIQEYVQAAQPVGSGWVEDARKEIRSATDAARRIFG